MIVVPEAALMAPDTPRYASRQFVEFDGPHSLATLILIFAMYGDQEEKPLINRPSSPQERLRGTAAGVALRSRWRRDIAKARDDGELVVRHVLRVHRRRLRRIACAVVQAETHGRGLCSQPCRRRSLDRSDPGFKPRMRNGAPFGS